MYEVFDYLTCWVVCCSFCSEKLIMHDYFTCYLDGGMQCWGTSGMQAHHYLGNGSLLMCHVIISHWLYDYNHISYWYLKTQLLSASSSLEWTNINVVFFLRHANTKARTMALWEAGYMWPMHWHCQKGHQFSESFLTYRMWAVILDFFSHPWLWTCAVIGSHPDWVVL